MSAFPPMPETSDREPFDPKYPDGLRESDVDWVRRNIDATRWFIEHHAAIRAALSAGVRDGEKS